MLVVLTVAGAVLGATLGIAPSERFVAEAAVAVQLDPEAVDVAQLQSVQWRTAATTALLPVVLRAAAQSLAPAPELKTVQERVSIAGSPGSSVLRIQARDRSVTAANALATAVGRETVLFLRRVSRTNLRSTNRTQSFTFDRGLDGWSRIGSLFAVPPTRLARDESAQQGGTHSLRVVCGPTRGCGPHVGIQRTFVASSRYRATIYARAAESIGPAARVRLVLGTSGRDIAAGTSFSLSSTRWQLLTVRWAPAANSDGAELAVQSTSRGPATFFLDTATVAESIENVDRRVQLAADAQSRRQRARRVAQGDSYVLLGAASPAGEIQADTLGWTIGGALLGLLMGGAGLAATELARRRQHTQREPCANVDAVPREV